MGGGHPSAKIGVQEGQAPRPEVCGLLVVGPGSVAAFDVFLTMQPARLLRCARSGVFIAKSIRQFATVSQKPFHPDSHQLLRRRALPQIVEKRGSNKKQGFSKSSIDEAVEAHRELLNVVCSQGIPVPPAGSCGKEPGRVYHGTKRGWPGCIEP